MDRSYGSRPQVCFEVEKVIGISSDGSYQVQWAPAWVSKFHLVGCEHLIQEFLQTQPEKNDAPERLDQIPNQPNDKFLQRSDMQIHQSNHYNAPVEYDGQDGDRAEGFEQEHIINVDNNAPDLSWDQLDGSTDLRDRQIVRVEISNSVSHSVNIDVKSEDLVEEEDAIEILDPSTSGNSQESPIISRMHHFIGSQATTENSTVTSLVHPEDNTNCSKHIEPPSGLTFPEHSSLDKKYICSICGRQCLDKQNLRIHLRVHSGERPFVCKYCGKGFTQSGNLKTHLRMHTGEKPFSCDICGKNFARKFVLEQHVATHSAVKPYSCEICGKTFSRTFNLDKHRARCSVTASKHVINS